jgi:hypothetical protein
MSVIYMFLVYLHAGSGALMVPADAPDVHHDVPLLRRSAQTVPEAAPEVPPLSCLSVSLPFDVSYHLLSSLVLSLCVCVVLTGHRYNVPKGAPVDAKKTQLRVTVIVKYWVENQFFDFDEVLIARLNDWINNTLPKVFYFQNPRMVPFFYSC